MQNTKPYQIPYVPTEDSTTYPETDGEPLAETERHLRHIIRMLDMLENHFLEVPDVYVWSNMMMYYKRGNPKVFVKPDIFVSFGIGKQERRIYKVWEEGKPPDFIMEFASKSTYNNDLTVKKEIYTSIGVTEYFLYDPYKSCLPSTLMGYRRVGEEYIEIPTCDNGFVRSETLNLEFQSQDDGCGVFDPVTGEWLRTRAEKEAAEREKAEDELEKLREKIKRMDTKSTDS